MAASECRWPKLGYEDQLWTSKYAEFGTAGGPVSRKYKSSVPPFIAKLAVPISSAVAALAEDATERLIRFDSSLGGEIAPFASLLLRSEAVASSRIENLTANARSILTAELGDTSKPNATIIAANTKAMRAALELAGDLTPSTVLKMHQALMEGDPHHPAGEWRQEPIWIGTSALSPVGATYVGPDSARIPHLMDDMMDFARRDDIPRLVQAAVAHAQFETIHPFTDGNGRTGRALIQAMLRGKRLTNNVTVPVSAGLLTNTDSYHAALTSYREGDLEPLIALMAEASIRAVENATQLVQDVHAVQQRWGEGIRARSNSGVWKVADLLARQPVLNAAAVAEHLGIAQSNAYTYLRSLEDQGILKSKSEYKLGKLWRSDEILGALDEFAARSGRRGYGQRG